jgi:hypothetical protein
MVAAKIPAPAKSPFPISFSLGVIRNMKIIAIIMIINETLFFKKTNFVGSSFKYSDRRNIAFDRILRDMNAST